MRADQLVDKAIKLLSGDTNAIFLSGEVGSGKSVVADRICRELVSNHFVDAALVFNEPKKPAHIYEFIYKLCLGLTAEYELLSNAQFSESEYNNERFEKLRDEIRSESRENFNDLVSGFSLKSTIDTSPEEVKYPFAVELIEAIEKRSDRRMFEKPLQLATESLFVDLTGIFHRDITSKIKLSEDFRKTRILIVFDDFDSFDSSLIDWLNNHFLKTYLSGKFGNFVNYSDERLEVLAIKDLFEIKFLFSSRRNSIFDLINLSDFKRESLELSLLDEEETLSILKAERIELPEVIENISIMSHGNPFILTLMAESYRLGGDILDLIQVYQLVETKIFYPFSVEQQDWIRSAAYLGTVDMQGLRCFPTIGDNFEAAFTCIKNAEELYYTSNGEIIFKEYVKSYIIGATKYQSEILHKEFERISANYNSIRDIIKRFSDDELEIIRKLAYFRKFDLDFALKAAFRENESFAKQTIEKNIYLFNKHEFTFSFKDKYSSKIDEFNSLVDRMKLAEKKELVHNINNQRINKLKSELNEKTAKSEHLEKQKEQFNYTLNQKEKEKQRLNEKYIELENMLLKLQGEYDSLQKNKKIAGLKVSLTALLIFLLSAIFPEMIFSFLFEHESTINLASYFSYGFAIILLIWSVLQYIRYPQTGIRKVKSEQIETELHGLESQKNEIQSELEDTSSSIEMTKNNIIQLDTRITSINNQAETCRRMLKEKFI